jgi:membrane fusion protein (multidrug efflux system)
LRNNRPSRPFTQDVLQQQLLPLQRRKSRMADAERPDVGRENEDDDPSDGQEDQGGANPAQGKKEGEEEQENKPSFLRRHPVWVAAGLVLVVVAAVGGYFYWKVDIHPYESTDDAFVDARQFAVAPKVAGYVAEVLVTDNQHVEAGAALFRIDPRDYQIALEQAQAQAQAASASVQNVQAQIASQRSQVDQAQAQLEQAQASLEFAEEEARRYQQLASRGFGSQQQSQQATSSRAQQEAAVAQARAAVTAADQGIKSLQAQEASAQAQLAQAHAKVAQAELDLSYATVKAAQSGRIARLTAAKGQLAQAGQSLSMFVPDDIWVTANFKETQITDMRPGQPVAIEIDAYPDVAIRGRVDSVQPGSGTAFSLLPAENATGNYIKVVQRVPVKIEVERWPDGVAIGPGMSVVPTVTVRPEG